MQYLDTTHVEGEGHPGKEWKFTIDKKIKLALLRASSRGLSLAGTTSANPDAQFAQLPSR